MPVAPNGLIDWLIDELEQKNWSPNEASQKAGLSRNSLSTYINGTQPGLHACKALARLFNKPPEYVLYLAGHLPAPPGADAFAPDVAEIAYRIQLRDHPIRERLIDQINALLDTTDAIEEEMTKVRIIGDER